MVYSQLLWFMRYALNNKNVQNAWAVFFWHGIYILVGRLVSQDDEPTWETYEERTVKDIE